MQTLMHALMCCTALLCCAVLCCAVMGGVVWGGVVWCGVVCNKQAEEETQEKLGEEVKELKAQLNENAAETKQLTTQKEVPARPPTSFLF